MGSIASQIRWSIASWVRWTIASWVRLTIASWVRRTIASWVRWTFASWSWTIASWVGWTIASWVRRSIASWVRWTQLLHGLGGLLLHGLGGLWSIPAQSFELYIPYYMYQSINQLGNQSIHQSHKQSSINNTISDLLYYCYFT